MDRRSYVRLPAAILAALCLATTASADTGEEDDKVAFNNACRTCHAIDAGDHRLGPSLHGVVGREAGSIDGYGFTSAMKQSGITWDEETLDKFIASPEQVVPGNGMKPFGGIQDEAQRKQIIAYLKSISE